MADALSCPACGEEIESAEELESGEGVPEIEVRDDGSIRLFENRDRFLCRNCKRPFGMPRP